MAFESWADFWSMGRHGFYVWLVYGSAALVVLWNVWQPYGLRKKLEQEQRAALRRERR